MSIDLFVTLPDETLFSEKKCVAFLKQFGTKLVFCEGIDLSADLGWIPCEVSGLGAGSHAECGFDLDRLDCDSDSGSKFVLNTKTSEPNGWVAVHLFALYCVAKCDAIVEDPQVGTEYTCEQLEDFERVVRDLVDAMTQSPTAEEVRQKEERRKVSKLLKAAAKEVLGASGFIPDRSGLNWFEDHGWFVLCFRFSRHEDTASLMVWAHLFWNSRPISKDSWYDEDYGAFFVRLGNKRKHTAEIPYIAYTTSDAFYQKAVELAQRGLVEAENIRNMSDWDGAKKTILYTPWVGTFSDQQSIRFNRIKFCILTSHPSTRRLLGEQVEYDCEHGRRDWCDEMDLSLLDNLSAAQAKIAEDIVFNRQVLHDTMLPGLDLSYRLECPQPDPTDEDIIPDDFPKRPSLLARLLRRR